MSETTDDSNASDSSSSLYSNTSFLVDYGPIVEMEGYGIDIDPTLVIPSISRPVWEPPALELLDLFESKEWEKIEEWATEHLTITDSTALLDLQREMVVLLRYCGWVKKTGRDAIATGDAKKEALYENLLRDLGIEVTAVGKEIIPLKMKMPLREGAEPFSDDHQDFDSHREWKEMFELRRRASSDWQGTSSASSDSLKSSSTVTDWSNNNIFTDWADNLYNLRLLFSDSKPSPDWANNLYDLHLLFDDSQTTPGPRSLQLQSAIRVTRGLPSFSFRKFASHVSTPWKRPEPATQESLPSVRLQHEHPSEDLIDLNPSPTECTTSLVDDDIDNIIKSTGIKELSEIDRLLS